MTHGPKNEDFPSQRIVKWPRDLLKSAARHPLTGHLMPTDAGHFPAAKGQIRRREAGLDETLFIYCVRGRGWCELGEKGHLVERENLLVLPAGLPHAYGANAGLPWTIYWFRALGASLPAYQETLGSTLDNPIVPISSDVHLLALFEELLGSMQGGFVPGNLLYSAHVLSHLMGLLLRNKQKLRRSEVPKLDKVAATIKFMKTQLQLPVAISTLAAMSDSSPSYYRDLFKRVTGRSPMAYFIQLRMQQAALLLNTTDLSIKVISAEVGYSDQLYFSRAFRSVHGLSPLAYRRHRHR
jgi:AraC-like DNA-binding protein